MLVAAPTCGSWGNEYNEAAIAEATKQISDTLHEPECRLIVREVVLIFDQGTIQQQSRRPAMHKFFMAVSDQMHADKVLSHFTQSQLWVRQLAVGKDKVPMQPIKNMVDPRRNFAAAGGSTDISKQARRKQWLSGWPVVAAFHDALWPGMPVTQRSVAAWIDVFAFDHSLPEALMRRADTSGTPHQLYVGAPLGRDEQQGQHCSGPAKSKAEGACQDCQMAP